jgi:hypothetical protein
MDDPSPDELMALVDERHLDRLLAVVTIEDVADAWWRYTTRDRTKPDELADAHWWAIELWIGGGPVWDREDLVRRGLAALAERAPDGADLGSLGAGPIEDSVIEDDDRLRWIEEQAERSPNFKAALANVWIQNLSPGTFLRVERAACVELPWPSSAGTRPSP